MMYDDLFAIVVSDKKSDVSWVWVTNLSGTSPMDSWRPGGHGVVTPSLGSLCWKSTAAGRNAGGTSAGRGAGDGGRGEDFRCLLFAVGKYMEIHWQYMEIPENNWCSVKCLKCIFWCLWHLLKTEQVQRPEARTKSGQPNSEVPNRWGNSSELAKVTGF